MSQSPLYKTPEARAAILELYDKKLQSLGLPYEELDIQTAAGKTRVIAIGDPSAPPVVALHGINAGAPVTLDALKGLRDKYRIYAVDTIGQTTKSAETRLPVKGNAYGKWLAETMNGLELEAAAFVGVSYGAFLLQRLIAHAPEKVKKAIFVVPGGLVNGPFFKSMKKLTFPLMKFMRTKKDADLIRFMDAFFNSKEEHWVTFQRQMLTGVKVDYRKPPLLTAKEVHGFTSPVYALVAEDDVFFPGPQALKRCKQLFPNFKGSAVLQGAKHIPDREQYPQIEKQVRAWLEGS